jgi:hypothetical protein
MKVVEDNLLSERDRYEAGFWVWEGDEENGELQKMEVVEALRLHHDDISAVNSPTQQHTCPMTIVSAPRV